jgi:hypothetical protein
VIDSRRTIESVASHPDMFGLDRRYMTLVAFIIGYDEATGRDLLGGFRDWVAQRLLDIPKTPIFWASLIAKEHGVDNWKEVPSEKDDELREALKELLVQFLEVPAPAEWQ